MMMVGWVMMMMLMVMTMTIMMMFIVILITIMMMTGAAFAEFKRLRRAVHAWATWTQGEQG
jgi:Na+-transporting methylmalonyl-CoA/oxaloacetate decarboxylase gamma subunit